MSLPVVSVICICFNHEAFVQQAINSVLNQSYKNIELIVINNASSDNSHQVITDITSKNTSIKYIQFTEPISSTKAFNYGYKQSKGTYLIDLSADDVLLDDCIEKQVNFFAQQTDNVGLIFGNAHHINENGNRTKPYFKVDGQNKAIDLLLHETNYLRLLSTGIVMCSVASMLTRKHFELLKGYNEELFFEDLDYWLRLSRLYEIKFLDDFLVEKRFLENSLGNQFHKNDEFSKKINQSLRQIYNESIVRNTSKKENKTLLKRIHYSMEQSFKNKQWLDLLKLSVIELKCRFQLF
ncbi:Glycosyl transferase family 2 [Paenimyroides ummariense]|uniref:Glycosyl transferase family 2 n=1 Tax=Paenimyroides ummariense TaxID=913024 RepID=A0A1I4XN95_9FLAO|nr:glycosyltransferase [Paenimyroides ummariense]SFN27287.1 Glycosyl transferase family 2 [Paenimyroides ummariense]